MLTSSLFGGGYLTAYIPDGATAKTASSASNGVVLDVAEKGVFSFRLVSTSIMALTLTIDGSVYSGDSVRLLYSFGGYQTNSSFLTSITIPYSKSLKIEVASWSDGNLNVYRTSL